MRFLAFLARRIVGIAAVMIGVSVITFAISHAIRADPAVAALGDHATKDQIAAFRAEHHLDRPLPEQFLTYVVGIVHGDLGKVQASFDMGSAIIAAAGLSFIGFGARPPTPEWGVMISEGRNYISTQPWLSLFPGARDPPRRRFVQPAR